MTTRDRFIIMGLWMYIIGLCSIPLIYYPVRIYHTGKETFDIIEVIQKKKVIIYSKHENIPTSEIQYFSITGLNSAYYYHVDIEEGKHLRKGKTIRVYVSPEMKEGIYIADHPITLIYLIERYSPIGILAIPLLGAVGIAYIYLLAIIGYRTTKVINSETRKEIEESKRPINPPMAYASAYLTILVGGSLSYTLSFLLIRGAFLVEKTNEMLITLYLMLGVFVLIYIPFLFYKAKIWLKGLTNKPLSFSAQLLGLLLGIYTAYETIIFIVTEDFSKYKNIISLVRGFISSLIG